VTTYPLVECDVHRDRAPRPGWIVCKHIAYDCGVVIEHLSTPTPERLGEILCNDCYVVYQLDKLILMCAECVADLLRARDLTP
jgi:hypothetical protein